VKLSAGYLVLPRQGKFAVGRHSAWQPGIGTIMKRISRGFPETGLTRTILKELGHGVRSTRSPSCG
jgi:hypothetical protein